ncbi:MAG: hypothetical protein Q8K47_09585 [Nitrosomonas sp.]|nr:hypothetical protein [Nitrosomonas sp.]MDP1935110.1 hypothetical protein [Nitrosomonas sp.]
MRPHDGLRRPITRTNRRDRQAAVMGDMTRLAFTLHQLPKPRKSSLILLQEEQLPSR